MVNLNIIIDYIRKLSQDDKDTLYSSQIFTVSILKIFDDSTIRLIFDLLLTAPSIKSLQKNEEIKNSLKILLRLQLIVKRGANIYLNDKFRDSFFQGIENPNIKEYFEKVEKISNNDLIFDCNKFDDILNFLVSKENINLNNNIIDVLIQSKLINDHKDITNNGFEFLLKPKYEQYWYLVISALKYYCNDEKKQIKNFMSLMELSNLSSEFVYKFINQVDKNFYTFLNELGIIYSISEKFLKQDKFVLENLFVIKHNLFVKHDTEKSRYILIETNFKVYAYTSSTYEKSIIQLFTEIHQTLPNLIKGNLTEESLSNAFSKGVTSQQIINFIKTYSLFGDIPDTVINQIEIWESKRKRIKILPGYLYSNFLNLVDYQKFVKFCASKDCIIDRDDERRMVIIKTEYNEIVKEYTKKQISK
ncbi:general transcription and DNA repair factor IIH subunit TFB2 [Vairimorpha necatrix]|uniref:RNA polymerase II transcription factor B subunit 2 n=1 Tax=Vairimorpha necatrix TaxID=6039 RepID=A0AAX4JD82_9MICR